MIARMALVARGMRLKLERRRAGLIGGNENDMMAVSYSIHIKWKSGYKGDDCSTRVANDYQRFRFWRAIDHLD
jgi:hypothetical protein